MGINSTFNNVNVLTQQCNPLNNLHTKQTQLPSFALDPSGLPATKFYNVDNQTRAFIGMLSTVGRYSPATKVELFGFSANIVLTNSPKYPVNLFSFTFFFRLQLVCGISTMYPRTEQSYTINQPDSIEERAVGQSGRGFSLPLFSRV